MRNRALTIACAACWALAIWPLGGAQAAESDDDVVQIPEGRQVPFPEAPSVPADPALSDGALGGPSGAPPLPDEPAGTPSVPGGPAGTPFVPGQLIVKLREGFRIEILQELNQRYGVTAIEPLFNGRAAPEETLQALRARLAELTHEHTRWYWWADRDSPEAKEYEARVARERSDLERQIQTVEALEQRVGQDQAGSLENLYLLHVGAETDLTVMASDYGRHPAVAYAEPNGIVTIQGVLS